MNVSRVVRLEGLLNSPRPDARALALQELCALADDRERFDVTAATDANMHLHSFFSYSTWGHSPSRIVWEAWKRKMPVVGITDFDNLDGLQETYDAGDLLGQPVVFGLESRVLSSRQGVEINSPGERGVMYFMVHGIAKAPGEHEPGVGTLGGMRKMAQVRNREAVKLLNDVLKPVALSYEPIARLSPGGSPTERHIALAAARMILGAIGAGPAGVGYTQKLFDLDEEAASALLANESALADKVRSMLKAGGRAYLQPSREVFPHEAHMISLARDLGGVACGAFLDGVSLPGEQNIAHLVNDYVSLGCRGMNVITPRSTHDKVEQVQVAKRVALAELCIHGGQQNMLFSFGTEGNGPGQPFADNYSGEPYADYASYGAHALYGHTLMQRACGAGLTSQWAASQFTAVSAANNYYWMLGVTGKNPSRSIEAIFLSQGESPTEIINAVAEANRI